PPPLLPSFPTRRSSDLTASHPHFYGAIDEWAREFGAEILVPSPDAAWLRASPDSRVQTWSGTLGVLPGVTLVQCGGHFPGSAVVDRKSTRLNSSHQIIS